MLRMRNIGDDRYVKIRARYAGHCASDACDVAVTPGDEAWYDVEERKTYCADCGKDLHEEEDK